jgi:hypothetical protein
LRVILAGWQGFDEIGNFGLIMRLKIGGKERTDDLARRFAAEAAGMNLPGFERLLSDELSILDLRDAEDEAAFLDKLVEIYGERTQIDLEKCRLPSGSGGAVSKLVGALRSFAWRLLKFAFGWLVFNPNVINDQQVTALAHEVRLRQKENAELRSRIEELERRFDG